MNLKRTRTIWVRALLLALCVSTARAEPFSIRMRGDHALSQAWMVFVVDDRMQILPASFTTQNDTTEIVANRAGIERALVAAVAVTQNRSVLATSLDDSVSATSVKGSPDIELAALKSQIELLSHTNEDLIRSITIARTQLNSADYKE